jgi:predicted metal-dependent peptidase
MALTIGKKLTPQQRLHKALLDIMGMDEFIALSGVLMVGKKIISDTVSTACTDGRDEYYGKDFVESLNDFEFRFLILHETYHRMYRHLTTWEHLHKDNAQLANMAMDYVINVKLFDTDANRHGWIKMPECGLLDEQYRGMDVAQVYKKLKQDPPPSGGSGGGQGGSGAGSGQGMDEHDWANAQEMSAEERDALAREIDEAIRQGAAVAGKLGSGGDRLLSEVLQTKQDWRELLREFVTSTTAGKDFSTYRKVNRRFVGMDLLMPGSISEAVGDIVVAIDTSGSIGEVELAHFMGEVTGICEQVKPSRVHVMYWDTEVCRHEVYLQDELDDLVKSTKPAGGGGTMVECVTPYMRERNLKPECVVVLTDGYLGGDWGTWDVPVLWAINGNKNATANVGVTIHID